MFWRMIHSNEAPRVSQCPRKRSAFTKRVTSYRAVEKCQTAFAGILQAGCLRDPGALWVCLPQFIWYNREDWRVFVLHGRFQRSPSGFLLPPILQRCDCCCKNLLARIFTVWLSWSPTSFSVLLSVASLPQMRDSFFSFYFLLFFLLTLVLRYRLLHVTFWDLVQGKQNSFLRRDYVAHS